MNQLYMFAAPSIRIRFTETPSAVDPRLVLRGELLDSNGARIWAGYGRTQVEILQHAAAWLDDCHGRAGHTPVILADESWPGTRRLAESIQREVQQRQAARLI